MFCVYQLVVLEDDVVAAQEAVRAVSASPYASRFAVSTVSTADGLGRMLEEGAACDVLIADIRLGGEGASEVGRGASAGVNGIQAVRELFGRGCGTQVIYLTGYIEYCTEVYETDHACFLTKPIDQSDFDKALARALESLDEGVQGALLVKAGRSAIAVPFGDITFIESRLRKLDVHVGKQAYTIYGTVSGTLERLPDSFAVTHQSFIVNLGRVRRVDSGELLLDTGERIPLSKRRRGEVREAFFSRLGR